MYNHVFVAGTFDRLHTGHEAVLSRAFAEGENVTIGITTDSFVKEIKKLDDGQWIREEERKKRVQEWVEDKGWGNRATFIAIHDRYEPAATGDFDAIVVTTDNEATGKRINELRYERSLPPLAFLIVALIPAQDGQPISSTRMRKNEIDAWGTLLLPENLRPELKDPMGEIVRVGELVPELKQRTGTLITVGDVTTDRMLTNGIIPDLSIIDLQAERLPYKSLHNYAFSPDVSFVHIKSGPGFISHEALTFLSTWEEKKKKFVLVIAGEDDLLVLPAIYYAKIGDIILYGQPKQGMVKLVVTADLQEKVYILLGKFITSSP